MPDIWKQANVIPIFKKGDRSDPNNYRPVSLLNTTGKKFEKIIYKYLFNFFQRQIRNISVAIRVHVWKFHNMPITGNIP